MIFAILPSQARKVIIRSWPVSANHSAVLLLFYFKQCIVCSMEKKDI